MLNHPNSFLHFEIQTRHRDLCYSAGIAPFSVVERYQDVVQSLGYLPHDRLPSFAPPEESVTTLKPNWATSSEPRTKPAPAPVEDVVMTDVKKPMGPENVEAPNKEQESVTV